MRTRRSRHGALAVLLGLLLLAGCGPTDEECARAVLFVTPAPFAVGALLLWLLHRLWRRLLPEALWDWRPHLYALVFLVCFSGLSLTAHQLREPAQGQNWSASRVLQLSGFALWFYGTGYLVVLLFVWRLWFAIRRSSAFNFSFVVPLGVFLAPGLPLAAGLTDSVPAAGLVLWIYTGALGIAPGVLLVLLLAEVLIRRRVQKPAAPPAVEEAR